MLYVKVLEKVLNEWDIKRSQYAQVKRVCETTLQEIKSALIPPQDQQVDPNNQINNNNKYRDGQKGEHSTLLQNGSGQEIEIDSEKYFLPLEMACQINESSKVTIAALDGIQKLLAHGQLAGNCPTSANPNKRLIDKIVETICSCSNSETDDGVELQIIKGLLTVVTCQHTQIHEGSLLLTLKTCFNIHLSTKSSINQTTSRAMLTQMMHAVFSRMESAYEGISQQNNNKEKTSYIEISNPEKAANGLENSSSEINEWFQNLDLSSFCSIKTNPNQLSSSNNVHESNPFLEDQSLVENENNQETIINKDKINSSHILQKDAFLIFWAVCKLASKQNTLEDSVQITDERKETETKSQILSFQLLKSVLENSGQVFRSNQMFTTALKQYLYSAMIEVGVSQNSEIYQLNLDLIVILIHKFQSTMCKEIERLCEEVLFPVLDQPETSTLECKMLALNTLKNIFHNFQPIVDLFMNSECTDHGVVGSIIYYICEYAHPSKYCSDVGSASAQSMRTLSVELLTSVLKQMMQCLDTKKVCSDYSEYASQVENEPIVKKYSEDFENLASEFVSSLFKFLSNISLSVTVNEIDLMLQAIAQALFEKYSFGEKLNSADAIYLALYAALSIVDEISSKHAQNKNSKEWFKRDVTWFENLPEDFYKQIYNEIEVHMKQQTKYRKHENITSVQSHNVVQNARHVITLMGLRQPTTIILLEKQNRSIRKMFKIIAKPCLNALMANLIMFDDASTTDTCLCGLQWSIHIASVLGLKVERESFIQALSKLSLSALQEIKSKTASALVIKSKTSSTTTTENGITKTTITTTTETKSQKLDQILTLLKIAVDEGNYLNNSWLDILKCISQLEAAELMKKTQDGPPSKSPTPSGESNSETSKSSWYDWAGSLVPNFWDYSANKLDIASVRESMDLSVQQIFLNSTKLDEKGIVDFCKALCQVSLIEICHPETPRSFVYEKIFEVAQINLYRSSSSWCDIWQVLADFFSHLACSSDDDVSFFGIDSISKLVIHLLDKETFGNFRFQTHFLKPFETIMENTPFVSTRSYILQSIVKIMAANISKLRSGWINIFRILRSSIYNDDTVIRESSFVILKNILDLFANNDINLSSSYQELLYILKELSFKGPTPKIQKESLKMVQKVAKLVHEKPEIFCPFDCKTKDLQPIDIWICGWRPLFYELSSVIINADKEKFSDTSQANSMTVVFDLIKQYGDTFEEFWWKELFKILFLVFDKLKWNGEDELIADESLKAKGYSQFYCYYYVQFAIVDIFIKHHNSLGPLLLEDVIQELEWCISQSHEQMALCGLQCLHQIIKMLQDKLNGDEWTLIVTLVKRLLHDSLPVPDKKLQQSPLVQLELFKVVKTILIPQKNAEITECEEGQETNKNNMITIKGKDNLFLLLDGLEESMELAKSWVPNDEAIKITSLQENLIMETYLCFLLQIYFTQENFWANDEFVKIEARFTSGVCKVLKYFVFVHSKNSSEAVDSIKLNETITACIKSIHHKLPKEKFAEFARIFYFQLCDLLELELDGDLSGALSKYFLAVIRSKILVN